MRILTGRSIRNSPRRAIQEVSDRGLQYMSNDFNFHYNIGCIGQFSNTFSVPKLSGTNLDCQRCCLGSPQHATHAIFCTFFILWTDLILLFINRLSNAGSFMRIIRKHTGRSTWGKDMTFLSYCDIVEFYFIFNDY